MDNFEDMDRKKEVQVAVIAVAAEKRDARVYTRVRQQTTRTLRVIIIAQIS